MKKGFKPLQRPGARPMPPGEPTHYHRFIHLKLLSKVLIRQPMDQFIVPKLSKSVRGAPKGHIAEEREELGKLSDGGLGPSLLPVDNGHLVNAQLCGDLVLK